MDGRGRLAESLNPDAPEAQQAASRRRETREEDSRASASRFRSQRPTPTARWLDRRASRLSRFTLRRGAGVAASIMIVAASAAYGAVRGGHVVEIANYVRDLRDMAGNAAGFRLAGVGLSGHKNLNREEILARAGITGRTSLLFFDVADARARLMTDPRIADATLLKLYPDRLQITVTERQAFALWQQDGRVSVIAHDGTVLEPYVSRPFADLPLVVGRGADARARDFLALLDRYPPVRDNVRAAILIAERRWNLRLKNGMDVRLPEVDPDKALDRLVALDRDNKLMTRDIAVIDLRLADRVTVRLSDAAALARDAALKEQTKKKKGGPA
jgi:cell division protein FtsQ